MICYTYSMANLISIICVECDNEFFRLPRGRRTICSKACVRTRKCRMFKESKRISDRQYYQRNRQYMDGKSTATRLRKNGWTIEAYNEAFNLQEGRCLICGKHQSEEGRSLSADHNHETGKRRGLLCNTCNRVLGLFHDNPFLLIKAADYLRSYSSTELSTIPSSSRI